MRLYAPSLEVKEPSAKGTKVTDIEPFFSKDQQRFFA